MTCSFCGGPAHPATGCVYGPNTIACRACTVEFWAWVKAHTNKRGRRSARRDGTMRPEPALTFYEAAGRWTPERRAEYHRAKREAALVIPQLIQDRPPLNHHRGWAAVVERVERLAAEKVHQRLTRESARAWLMEMNAALREVSRGDYDFAHGWELRFWTCERDRLGNLLDPIDAAMWGDRRLTIVAVDPRGIAHDLCGLAEAEGTK